MRLRTFEPVVLPDPMATQAQHVDHQRLPVACEADSRRGSAERRSVMHQGNREEASPGGGDPASRGGLRGPDTARVTGWMSCCRAVWRGSATPRLIGWSPRAVVAPDDVLAGAETVLPTAGAEGDVSM